MRIVLIILFSLSVVTAQAQLLKRKKKSASSQAGPSATEPNSLAPSSPQKQYGPKKSKKGKLAEPTYGSEADYYKRLEELQKTRRKNERMMEKPQYSDPMYFGHKHPPKKRPPGKMKFCKVCGLRH